MVKGKKTDGIKEIGENFGKKLQEKVMILQLISAAAGFIQQFITSEDCENMFQKMSYSF